MANMEAGSSDFFCRHIDCLCCLYRVLAARLRKPVSGIFGEGKERSPSREPRYYPSRFRGIDWFILSRGNDWKISTWHV